MTPAAPALPVDDWKALLTALCSDAPEHIGTLAEPGTLTLVQPTRFPWLRGFRWRPVGDTFGLALLDLTDPGTLPASAWEPLCGSLHKAPPTRDGPILFGRFEAPATGHTATLTLVTDDSAEGASARVIAVRIRVEPTGS
jgi:hypothetical protein